MAIRINLVGENRSRGVGDYLSDTRQSLNSNTGFLGTNLSDVASRIGSYINNIKSNFDNRFHENEEPAQDLQEIPSLPQGVIFQDELDNDIPEEHRRYAGLEPETPEQERPVYGVYNPESDLITITGNEPRYDPDGSVIPHDWTANFSDGDVLVYEINSDNEQEATEPTQGRIARARQAINSRAGILGMSFSDIYRATRDQTSRARQSFEERTARPRAYIGERRQAIADNEQISWRNEAENIGRQVGLDNVVQDANLQVGFRNIANNTGFQLGAYNLNNETGNLQLGAYNRSLDQRAALGIVNRNESSHLDLAVLGNESGMLYGVGAAIVNAVQEAKGLFIGGVNNIRNISGYGIMPSFSIGAANIADETSGSLQLGAFNAASNADRSFQIGGINLTEVLAGFQWGIYNKLTNGIGFQLGIVNNATGNFSGVRIGFMNTGNPTGDYLEIGFHPDEEGVDEPFYRQFWRRVNNPVETPTLEETVEATPENTLVDNIPIMPPIIVDHEIPVDVVENTPTETTRDIPAGRNGTRIYSTATNDSTRPGTMILGSEHVPNSVPDVSYLDLPVDENYEAGFETSERTPSM